MAAVGIRGIAAGWETHGMPTIVEELNAAVGTVLGPTAWREVTQDMIDSFALLSGDKQWIHTDIGTRRP